MYILFLDCQNNQKLNQNSIKKTDQDEKLSKIYLKTKDIKTMTFDEFNLFLKDYSNNAEYPDINK